MTVDNLLTKKQQNVYTELSKEDWFIAVLHGAVRSGKTFIDNIIFLAELRRVARIAKREGVTKPQYILAGFTMANINDNILVELADKFGIEVKCDRFGSFTLFGVKVVQTTTANKMGVGRIRGMTSYGAYINEASLADRSVFEEIKTRCSGTGARMVCDTNPDSPEHWLKKDYIDKVGDSIKEFHFKLDDNTFLSPRYTKSLKDSTPTGMFYDRAINGEWVSALGTIYADFNGKRDFITEDDAHWYEADEMVFGIDWGYEHWGSITALARFGTTWVLVDEDSQQHNEIDQWVDRMRAFESKYGRHPVYADSARPEHVDRFIREGFNTINADKAVLAGIEHVAGLMKTNNFKVIGDNCPRFKKEIYSYAWNEKTGNPIKENDDCLDSLRYAIYTHEHKPVEWRTNATITL